VRSHRIWQAAILLFGFGARWLYLNRAPKRKQLGYLTRKRTASQQRQTLLPPTIFNFPPSFWTHPEAKLSPLFPAIVAFHQLRHCHRRPLIKYIRALSPALEVKFNISPGR
jgi:hypothetical protein